MEKVEKKILVLHTAFLGDILLSIPFFLKLKQLYPECEIELICRKFVGDFFLKTKVVDRVYEIQKGNSKAYKEVQKLIANNEYQIFFCPHQSVRSYLFSFHVKAKQKITYRMPFNFLGFDQRIKRDKSLPEPLRMMQLLTTLSADVAKELLKLKQANNFYQTKNHLLSETPFGYKINLSDRILSDSFSFFSLKKKINLPEKEQKWICVFPGSVWETKKWPLEHYKKLVGQLLAANHAVFLMGAPGEEKLCAEIFHLYEKKSNLYNFSGLTTVYESALLMSHSDLVVGNDSASSHLATVCNKKLITFFGPTVLSFGYRPWGDQVYIFQNENLKCRPCGPHGHHKCPIGTHECMKSVMPEEVSQFINNII